MDLARNSTTIKSAISTPTRARLFFSAARYLAGKALTILVTIFVGVFITMLIVSYPTGSGDGPNMSPFELRLETQIDSLIYSGLYDGTIPRDSNGAPDQNALDAFTKKLRSDAGLDLRIWPRRILWTLKALTFNWGTLDSTYVEQLGVGPSFRSFSDNVALQFLPNTLLLIGIAYLLVFLIGMPLALHLARNHGNWLDRFLTILSPISSVPSWVFAVLLITIFAVQLHWLPVGGMFDFHKPEDPLEATQVLLKHMILPVSALVLSLLFQLVYTWRTFFIIYSEEDYVDLARAKGLANRTLEKQYILKPALPYIITSFATSLIAFWQLTVALEAVFQWPGIGLLYIKSLPNYWKESVQNGDLMIVIQIVVIFAYLLGLLVFLLDVIYVFVDPRIHLVPASHIAQTNARVKRKSTGWASPFKAWMKNKSPVRPKPAAGPDMKRAFSWSQFFRDSRESMREIQARSRLFIQELRMYPSAIFGLIVIVILLAGSFYAVFALPYEQFGREFDENRVKGYNLTPRLAAPLWFNYFSRTPRLSMLIMDENSKEANISFRTTDNGWVEKTTTFKFDYNYGDFPSDVFLYLDPKYTQKFPFVSMVWTTPGGKTIDLKAQAVGAETDYDFGSGISTNKLLNKNPEWKKWFVISGQYPTPAYELLFAKPDSIQSIPQRGTYQLEIKSLFFENDSDLQSKLVLLGQVYGAAGTDYWRRDLIVPLFWGMPFTLIIGFMGTLITTLIAMVLPAVGVWFGGGLDAFIQRLTEVNMVLPGLAIAVMANLLFGTSIWILLGIVVLLNAFGGPIKTFRSAFLQAKEAPYMEVARSYGASNFRIITHYLVPRILPVFIPHLVSQIPSFIFLEATLGFFNIKSTYPSWGRIIYDGLSRGALYGSPFWVLEPIFLLLLTGLAFAMLGSALERILNPRVIDQIPQPEKKRETIRNSNPLRNLSKQTTAGLALVLVVFVVMISSGKTTTFASQVIKNNFSSEAAGGMTPDSAKNNASVSATASVPTDLPATVSKASSTPTALPPTPTVAASPTATPTFTLEPTYPSIPIVSLPATYILQKGEYPYCIARRFNIDPNELIALNGLGLHQKFYVGAILKIPQTERTFPGDRVLKTHPAVYTVSTPGETVYGVACVFGDVDPVTIAQLNNISVDSILFVRQQLNIP
jgi:peptide/nickel transport system permease protein